MPVKLSAVSYCHHVHNASSPLRCWVIYRGRDLFSEDAQRKCLTLSNHHVESMGDVMGVILSPDVNFNIKKAAFCFLSVIMIPASVLPKCF